jgi:hypothetical protein
MQRPGHLAGQIVAADDGDELGRLVARERELARVDLDERAAAAQPRHAHRRSGAREEHEPQIARQRIGGQLERAPARVAVDEMQVIEHQRDVPAIALELAAERVDRRANRRQRTLQERRRTAAEPVALRRDRRRDAPP